VTVTLRSATSTTTVVVAGAQVTDVRGAFYRSGD
jgi:hypothetical protein